MDMIYPERLLGDHYMEGSSSFRIFQHQVNHKIKVHWHDFFEIAFVTGGKGAHQINGVPHPIVQGNLFLLTPADFHEIIPDAGTSISLYNMIFTEQFINSDVYEWLFREEGQYVCTFQGVAYDEIHQQFARIWKEANQTQAGSEVVIRGALERVLIDLMRQKQLQTEDQMVLTSSRMFGMHPSVRKAVLFMQHYFRESVTLDELARRVGLSANYLSDCFRKQTGHTIQGFLQNVRLQFARSLLLTTGLPITEIGFASGFRTFPNFEKAFKKKYGCSPRALRKQHM